MTYRDNEQAIEQPDSFELYRISNNITTYYLTSYSSDIVVDGNTYIAAPMQRGELVTDLLRGSISCTVNVPVTFDFVRYIIVMPFISTAIEIRKYFADDTTEGMLLFSGMINSIAVNRNVATLDCASSMDELNRKIPRVFVQSYCNNSLYGDTCGVNRADRRRNIQNVTTDLADSRVIRSAWLDGYAADTFTGGIAEYAGDMRYIAKHLGDTIFLQYAFFELPNGSTITALPGCNKSPEECVRKFRNLANFVGMPYVPKSPNPVLYGVD